MTSAPDLVVDGGDRLCVRLLIELRAHVVAARPGSVIHLIASDPAAPIDLPAWCHLTGNPYLGRVSSAEPPTYALRVGGETRVPEARMPWRIGER